MRHRKSRYSSLSISEPPRLLERWEHCLKWYLNKFVTCESSWYHTYNLYMCLSVLLSHWDISLIGPSDMGKRGEGGFFSPTKFSRYIWPSVSGTYKKTRANQKVFDYYFPLCFSDLPSVLSYLAFLCKRKFRIWILPWNKPER